MDNDLNFPAFYITNVHDSSSFSSVFNALVLAGFDINYPNNDSVTFLQKLIIEGEPDLNKINAILQTNPKINSLHIDELDAKVKLTWSNTSKIVKAAIARLKDYAKFSKQ